MNERQSCLPNSKFSSFLVSNYTIDGFQLLFNMDNDNREFRILVNFFGMTGVKKKKGYLVDSIILPMSTSTSEHDFFRAKSDSFEASLPTLQNVKLSSYMFVKGRTYRVTSFSVLTPDDELYVCEDINKQHLQRFLQEEFEKKVTSESPCARPAVSSSIETDEQHQNIVLSGPADNSSLKRKRTQTLKEKMEYHHAHINHPDYKHGPARQQYLERATVNAFRQYQAMSIEEFHNQYSSMPWKQCKLRTITSKLDERDEGDEGDERVRERGEREREMCVTERHDRHERRENHVYYNIIIIYYSYIIIILLQFIILINSSNQFCFCSVSSCK